MAITSELNADRLCDLIVAIAMNPDSPDIRIVQIEALIDLFKESSVSNIEQVDFSPVLVFDMDRIYNTYTQAGAITFTSTGSELGVTSKARIVSNGDAINFPPGWKIYQDTSTLTYTPGTEYDIYFMYDHSNVTVNVVEVYQTT